MAATSVSFLGDPSKRSDTLEFLHPKAIAQFTKLEKLLVGAHAEKRAPALFLRFEAYRTPARQRWLLQHTQSTKAAAWQSAHQYGLAVDFVPFEDGNWTWEAPAATWGFLATQAAACGLKVPYSWDKVHVEHPLFRRIMAAAS